MMWSGRHETLCVCVQRACLEELQKVEKDISEMARRNQELRAKRRAADEER